MYISQFLPYLSLFYDHHFTCCLPWLSNFALNVCISQFFCMLFAQTLRFCVNVVIAQNFLYFCPLCMLFAQTFRFCVNVVIAQNLLFFVLFLSTLHAVCPNFYVFYCVYLTMFAPTFKHCFKCVYLTKFAYLSLF